MNEDDDYSSSDEPEDQQIFDFKGVVGIRKHGSSRKWYIEWYSEDCNSSDDQFDWVDLVEDLTKYEGQAITLLSPGSKIKVKWAASSSSIAREIEAEVLCFSVGTGLHGVRYIEDSLFETVNLIHPTSRRPMWKWLSLPVGMQSPAPAEGEGCDQTGSYPSQNEMTQLKNQGTNCTLAHLANQLQ